jgi:glutamate dehydrogenase (NAD(P)+)
MAPDVSVGECFRLARAMTMKNAAAGLAHGGAKSVIFGDPRMPRAGKERIVRAFASALRHAEDYIVGPDMGTDEECMAWIRDETGRAVGLPREIGGIPLDEIGATGWGLLHACGVALAAVGREVAGSRFLIQGFGAVGRQVARFLSERGGIVVGAADSKGAVCDPAGLDVAALIELKREGASVTDYPRGQKLPGEAAIDIACDVWVPAARPDVINEDNCSRLKATLVVPGANIAVTAKAEQLLHARGVLCVPDFIANAGGVICAALEYHGATESSVFAVIEERIRSNTEAVLEAATKRGVLPRQAAVELATVRIRRAMGLRRHSLSSGAPGAL